MRGLEKQQRVDWQGQARRTRDMWAQTPTPRREDATDRSEV